MEFQTHSNKKIRALSAALVLIVAAGAMMTTFTAVSYAGTCSRLTGFPGLLQSAGLVAVGPCASQPKGAVCQSNATCITPNRRQGKCKNIAPSGPPNCACVESTISSGLR